MSLSASLKQCLVSACVETSNVGIRKSFIDKFPQDLRIRFLSPADRRTSVFSESIYYSACSKQKFIRPSLIACSAVGKLHVASQRQIQYDLEQVARWVKENKMELAPNKCFQLVIKRRIPSFRLAGGPLESSNSVIDLVVVVNT